VTGTPSFYPDAGYLASVFITFEGPEGAGKSTAIRAVAESLESRGTQVLVTREPGAGDFGFKIRELLLHGDDLPIWTELFLFLADRSHHVERIIRPALSAGKTVLCDRHADSTLVYQGYARGLDLENLRELNLIATGGLKPTLTFLLDLPVEIGLARLQNPDRLDREPLEFHQKVRSGFLAESRREPERWQVIDASLPPEKIVDQILIALANDRPPI